MPKQKFAIEAGGEKRLVAEWKGQFNDFKLTLDGTPLLAAPTKKELMRGVTAPLADGRIVRAVAEKRGLVLTIDGVPVPGSTTDPAAQVRTIVILLYALAGLNAVVGLVAEFGNVTFLLDRGLGWPAIVFGALLAGCAVFVRAKHSKLALCVAVGLFVLDMIATVVAALTEGNTPGIAGLVVKIIIVRALIGGFDALDRLQKQGAGR